MNNWTLEPFGKLADFKNGLNFRAGETGHELKVLGVGDFKERTKLEQVTDISSIHTEKKIDKSYLLQDGDLVFVRSNGNPALVGRCMQIFTNNEDISFSGFTIRARLKTDKTTPEFISLLMQGDLLKNILKRDGRGTNISNLNQDILSKLQIPIPSKAEQMELLSVFGCWDDAIEKTEALIAAKEKQFKWLCQTYFKPGNSTNSGWEKHKIATFVTVRNEREVPSEEAPLYSLTIENGVTAKTDRYNREFLVIDKGGKKYKVVHPKDIVFNPANLRWGAIARSEVEHKVVLSPIYEVLKVDKNKIDSDFLTYALTCSRQIAIFATMVEGTLVERMAVKIDTFLSCHIYVPSSKEKQKEIAHVLNLSKQEISLLKKTLEQYRSQKRGLMQKLLTGEWQVSSSQPVAEDMYQEASA